MEAVFDLERKRATERMQKKMAALFRVQGRSVIKEFVRFKRHFIEAALDTAIESMLDGALEVSVPAMVKDFSATGLAGYEWGYADLANNLGLQDAFSLPHPEAVRFANERAAARVAGVNNTTKKHICNLISYGVEEGESYGTVQRSIKRQFEQFAVGSPLEHIQSRAELIAVTEMGEAYEAGAATLSDELEAYGIDQEKSRVGPNDDRTSDACRADLAAGWIPKGEAFPSGTMSGLEHPGCRHGTIYRVARKELPGGPPSIATKVKAAKKAEKVIPKIPTKIVKAAKPPKRVTPERWAKDLSPEELRAVQDWQAGRSTAYRLGQQGKWDEALRELQSLNEFATMTELKTQVGIFNSAMSKSPNFRGTVYRGIYDLDDDVYRAITEAGKKRLTFDASSSASLDRNVAEGFTSAGERGHAILFEIKTKTGINVDGASGGAFIHEEEVILRKGVEYRLVRVEQLDDVAGIPWSKVVLEEI